MNRVDNIVRQSIETLHQRGIALYQSITVNTSIQSIEN